MPPDRMNFRPLPDGTGAHLTLNDAKPVRITTGGIDRLIVALIGLRAHLNPRRERGTPDDGTEMMSGPELSWAIGPGEEEGTAQLALFHPGLGWWCVDLGVADTLKAAGTLAKLVSVVGGGKMN